MLIKKLYPKKITDLCCLEVSRISKRALPILSLTQTQNLVNHEEDIENANSAEVEKIEAKNHNAMSPLLDLENNIILNLENLPIIILPQDDSFSSPENNNFDLQKTRRNNSQQRKPRLKNRTANPDSVQRRPGAQHSAYNILSHSLNVKRSSKHISKAFSRKRRCQGCTRNSRPTMTQKYTHAAQQATQPSSATTKTNHDACLATADSSTQQSTL
ncbi:hypothetical protein FQA39_LY03919 [Lamprigera yunnana]|nr:hypothetical protein FQA39_LY03919 [Lamprigera yunnana]